MGSKTGKRPLRHHSFILSLWLESGASSHSPPIWRYSLENPHTSVRRGFKEMAELVRFLEEWTADERPFDESTNI
jgi:hypothetical protein